MAWKFSVATFVAALALAGCADDKQGTTESESATGPTSTSAPTSTEDATTTPTTTGTSTGSETTGPPPAACDPSLQDCPAGQKCTAYDEKMLGMGWDSNYCVPEPMNGAAIGDPCEIDDGESVFSGLDNCATGGFCFNFDYATGKGGTCIEFCNEQDECPETNGGNAGCVEGAQMGVLPICLAKCDPLLQDCPDMQGCIGDISLDFFICVVPDPGMNTGMDGSVCEYSNACLPGFSCQATATVEGCDPKAIACCTPFCSVMGGDAPCGPAEDCIPFYMTPPPGLEDVGLCLIPQ